MIGLPYLFFWASLSVGGTAGASTQGSSQIALVSKYSRYFIVLHQEIAQTFASHAFWRF